MSVRCTEAQVSGVGEAQFSSAETASYTFDMLLALKCIAERQHHGRLAELLDAAAQEAKRLSNE